MKKIVVLLLVVILFVPVVTAQRLTLFTEESPPLNYLGSDAKPTGLAVEIVQEIQRRVGNTEPIQLVPWARGLARLDSESNVMLFAMGRTAARNPKYQWVGPIYENTYILYSLADASFDLKTIEDAKKLATVGVYRDDIRDQVLTGMGFTNLSRQGDPDTLARMLFAKRLDVIASSPDGVIPIIEKAGKTIADIKPQITFFTAQLYIGVSLGTPKTIVDTWNAALDAMRRDGTLRRLFEKYKLTAYYPGPAVTSF